MKKSVVIGVSVAAAVLLLGGVTQVALASAAAIPPAAASASSAPGTAQVRGNRQQLTDAQKAQMDQAKADRQQKVDAFVATLNADQKALYDAMMAKPQMGQDGTKPGQAAMDAMKQAMQQKHDAFVASLTDAQKTAFDQLFGGKGMGMMDMGRCFGKMGDCQGQANADAKAQNKAKLDAFVATLTPDQKALYDAMMAKPQMSQDGTKPDQDTMAAMKQAMQQKHDAFVASLTGAQKTAFDQLFGGKGMGMMGMGRGFDKSADSQANADAKAQYQTKLNAFLATLDANQKALYDAMKPVKPVMGQGQNKPDQAAIDAMKQDMQQKRDAFLNSLSDEQKAAYQQLAQPQWHGQKLQSADASNPA